MKAVLSERGEKDRQRKRERGRGKSAETEGEMCGLDRIADEKQSYQTFLYSLCRHLSQQFSGSWDCRLGPTMGRIGGNE